MFGDRLRNLRTSYRYTQSEMAEQFNVSIQTISNWENNNGTPTIEMVMDIAKFFRVTVDYLLDLDYRKFIEVNGLTPEQLATVQKLIDYIRTANKN